MLKNNDFLKAIIAQPDDDAIRLVYADWLEEQGDSERAELIRVQIELARLAPQDRRAIPLRTRNSTLLHQHQQAWQRDLPNLPHGAMWGGMHRGFSDTIVAHLDKHLLSIDDTILNATPYECLQLHAGNPPPVRLSGTPLLTRTRSLIIQRNMFGPSPAIRDDDLLRAIAAWPERQQWRTLELNSLELSLDGLQPLSQTPMPQLRSFKWVRCFSHEPLLSAVWLGQIVELELAGLPIHVDDYRRLWPRLPNLRRLTIRGSGINSDIIDTLIQSGLLPQLDVLDIENNDLGADGLKRLLYELRAHTLLAIDSNPIGEAGFIALAYSPAMANYHAFPRIRGAVGDAAFQALATSPYATNLVGIYHTSGIVGTLGLQAVLNSTHLRNLRSIVFGSNMIAEVPVCHHPTLAGLHLSYNQLASNSVTAFARESTLPQLEYLSLDNNQLGSEDCQALADAQGIPQLKSLNLSHNPIGDRGAMALLNGKGLLALKELHVEECRLSDRTLRHWQQSPRLAQLERIALRSENNHVTDEVYENFCEYALQLGCNVDYWATRPRLKSIRRPPRGRPFAVADRLALAGWINALHYEEYPRGAWLKVATLDELLQMPFGPTDKDELVAYRQADVPTDEQCRNALHCFLEHWMCNCVPESVSGGWGLSSESFERRSLASVQTVVQSIIDVSINAGCDIHGTYPHYIDDGEAPKVFVRSSSLVRDTISYDHVRRWFLEELFDPATAIYMVHEGPPIRIIGMDQHLIAQFW